MPDDFDTTTPTTNRIPPGPQMPEWPPVTSVVIAACRQCYCDGVGLHSEYGPEGDAGRRWTPLDGCAGLDRCGEKDPDLTVRVPFSITALAQAVDELVELIEKDDLPVAVTLARSIMEWLPHLVPGAAGSGDILGAARKAVDGRRLTYGEPAAFFAQLARRWSITLGRPVSAAEAVLMMIDVKLTRLIHNPQHRDSIVDIAGYAAILGEIASAARPAVAPAIVPRPAGPKPPPGSPW